VPWRVDVQGLNFQPMPPPLNQQESIDLGWPCSRMVQDIDQTLKRGVILWTLLFHAYLQC
jgi:hypothetical protein